MLDAKTGTMGPVIRTNADFRIEMCLPTASGCHFQEAETSVCRRF
jgi:hypothetical protein